MRSIAAIALVTISLACVAVRAAGVQATVRQAAVSSDAPATVSPRAAIDQYCTSCHNARLASGELRLDMLDLSTPVNWKDGEDVIIAGGVSDEDAKEKFPKGWTAPRPYLRITPQPNK